MPRPFHLAIAVNSIAESRNFYGNILGFAEARSSEKWVDWNCFGHQLVTHLSPCDTRKTDTNIVDGKSVPSNHFGVILEWQEWENFKARLIEKKVKFSIEPYIRFAGKTGEQATMFFLDPSNNALEFKAFKNDKMIFASSNEINDYI